MPHITIIGNQRREFLPLLQTLTQLNTKRQIIHFPTIGDALDAESGSLDEADLVIVLQSWSDQFQRSIVESLIGRTIFGRLLCCYGPWCESDGRTRDLWPDAVRVPLRLAPALIERELQDCDNGEPSLPPTTGRDELFSDRLGTTVDWLKLDSRRLINAAVIGADRAVRQTLAQNLVEAGIRSLHIPLIRTHPIRNVPAKETSRGPVHLVIHDLDPWSPVTEASLKAAHQMFPVATIWGIANMPDAGLTTEIADCNLDYVAPKLDLELGLRRQLQLWSTAKETSLSQYRDAI